MEKQFRYPGARPFSAKDGNLFFGREQDIRALANRIALEPLVVLFGKSGYGKTSLLQAGVLPILRERENHRTIELDLKEPEAHPIDLVIHQLQEHLGGAPYLGDRLNIAAELPDDLVAVLWCTLKSIQLAHPEHTWNTLVFDHFEDLFNSHQPHVESLGRALSEMLQKQPPKPIRRIIKTHMKSGADSFSEAELEAWFAPLNLKVVLSVRHDHLGSLDGLKPYIPYIFRHTYELKPLSSLQALEALERPAALEGDFASPAFTYQPKALEKIVSSLRDKRTQRIETFQLQLIAQHAEEAMMAQAAANPQAKAFTLSAKDLGNPDEIFENHYEEIILGLPRKNRGKARSLVEKRLILNGNRIPLPEQMITEQYHIPLGLVNTLVERRLVRSQLNSVGTTSYELSHDTLVPPILKTARRHRQKVLWRRLRIAGLLLLLAIIGFASWGTYQMSRADDLAKDVDSLRQALDQYKDSIRVVEVPGEVEVIDRLNIEIQQQRDTLDSLRNRLAEAATPTTGIGPVIGTDPPDTEVITGPVGPPIDDRILVRLPAQVHSEWIEKLDRLRTKLSADPDAEYRSIDGFSGSSDTRPPEGWDLDPEATHLLAIRVKTGRRVFDARNPKAFFVLLAQGKAYKFLGGTGFYQTEGDLAFLPKGQHRMKLGTPRADRVLVPYSEGVLLIRDMDRNGELSETDARNGLVRNPVSDLSIRWFTGGNAIDKAGEQLIFNQYYINSDDRIRALAGGSQGAYDRFVGILWGQPQGRPIYYTVLDLDEFDSVDRQEITRDIDRLTTGSR
ncbi:hypothetical protein OZ410_02470 [Robiginitalea sp. M366]|uniref:nSTAND1 domain-containing NTPase n=1 Tax=Robiginitalea aestuariiviva TaxID=3036903 RepID=UPI00240E0CD9|nr:hypothetical protein [Robiginitalea aestuariiviva]MDG1571163.1 hypothetical protein [Robiginitalea aestuariiviva]